MPLSCRECGLALASGSRFCTKCGIETDPVFSTSEPRESTPTQTVTNSAGEKLLSRRNEAGAGPMAAFAGGVGLLALGLYLVTLARFSINLATGQSGTTHPDLGVGVVLIIGGVALAWVGQAAAKRNLRR
jgi:hypothetical protein